MGGGGEPPCAKLGDMTKSTFHHVKTSWSHAKTNLNHSISNGKIGKYFKLEARKTSCINELRAGTATFLTMAYIISVNSSVIADSGGSCSVHDTDYDTCLLNTKSDLVLATSLVAMVGSFLMGVFANMPFALASGMGTNAYFAYNMVGFHGSGPLSYETALTIIMLEGIIFLLLSTLGLRAKLARAIPRTIRLASAVGIGLFLAFSGLQAHQGLGLVGPSESTLVTLSSKAMLAPTFWLGALGFIITSICLAKDMKGSMIYGIMFVTAVSWFRHTSVTVFPDTKEGNMSYEYFKKVVGFHVLKTTVGKIGFNHFFTRKVLIPLVTLLYVDILDTTGSMYSMAEYGEFTDEKGQFEGEYRAFIADASTTILSAVLGTTTVTTFLESTAGIKEGGRTGLTAVTVAFYFMLSLFFTPLFTSVPPWAVGPSLILVGVMMMKMVKDIVWGDMKEAVPAFLTMVLMPLTFSISNGIIAGLGVYVLINMYDYLVYGLKWMKKMRKMMTEARNQISVDSAEISASNV